MDEINKLLIEQKESDDSFLSDELNAWDTDELNMSEDSSLDSILCDEERAEEEEGQITPENDSIVLTSAVPVSSPEIDSNNEKSIEEGKVGSIQSDLSNLEEEPPPLTETSCVQIGQNLKTIEEQIYENNELINQLKESTNGIIISNGKQNLVPSNNGKDIVEGDETLDPRISQHIRCLHRTNNLLLSFLRMNAQNKLTIGAVIDLKNMEIEKMKLENMNEGGFREEEKRELEQLRKENEELKRGIVEREKQKEDLETLQAEMVEVRKTYLEEEMRQKQTTAMLSQLLQHNEIPILEMREGSEAIIPSYVSSIQSYMDSARETIQGLQSKIAKQQEDEVVKNKAAILQENEHKKEEQTQELERSILRIKEYEVRLQEMQGKMDVYSDLLRKAKEVIQKERSEKKCLKKVNAILLQNGSNYKKTVEKLNAYCTE